MKMLGTMQLAVGYDHKIVVEGINVEALKGQLVALLGPNGAGKSTILKSLSMLLAPIEGTVHVQGQDISRMKRRVLSKILAVVLTERLTVGFLSAFDVVAMGRYPHTGFLGNLSVADKDKVWECLRLVDADNIALRFFDELSDGEKQKIMLARALAQEPQLIILDEPTTHLDVKHKLEVMSILKKLSREKGITVIFSLHEIDLALKTCDVAIMVKDGKVVNFGAPEKVGSNQTVSALYDIDGAGFNAFIGTIELCNHSKPCVFVVGGGGKATGIYRMLTRNNVGFYTGILHENDVDCHIAETIGATVVREKAFQPIGDAARGEARSLMDQTMLVIDAGFPVGDLNRANIGLVLEALRAGKSVCTRRDEPEAGLVYGEWSGRMEYCRTISDMLQFCAGK